MRPEAGDRAHIGPESSQPAFWTYHKAGDARDELDGIRHEIEEQFGCPVDFGIEAVRWLEKIDTTAVVLNERGRYLAAVLHQCRGWRLQGWHDPTGGWNWEGPVRTPSEPEPAAVPRRDG